MSRTVLRAAVARGALLAAVWWAVSEGSGIGWGLGVVAVGLAVATSLWLEPPGAVTVRLLQVPRFLVWFTGRSAAGGVDVARRALRRPVDVAPGTTSVPLRLPPGQPRVALADAVSLLPGTLAVELGDDDVVLHVLDRTRPVQRGVAELEEQVARLYGLRLPPARDGADPGVGPAP
jgi:multicomponent Na+:H+ antiporter subunit E